MTPEEQEYQEYLEYLDYLKETGAQESAAAPAAEPQGSFIDQTGEAVMSQLAGLGQLPGAVADVGSDAMLRGEQALGGPSMASLPVGASMQIADAIKNMDFSGLNPRETMRDLTKAGGAGVGSGMGMLKGAALGTMGGPFAPVTVPLGALGGALVGGSLGQMGGDLAFQGAEGAYDLAAGNELQPLTNPVTPRNIGEGMVGGAVDSVMSVFMPAPMRKYLESLNPEQTLKKGVDNVVRGMNPTAKRLTTGTGVDPYSATEFFYTHPDVVASGSGRTMETTQQFLRQRLGGQVKGKQFPGTLAPQLNATIRQISKNPESSLKMFSKTAPDGTVLEPGLFTPDNVNQTFQLDSTARSGFDATTNKTLDEQLYKIVQDEREQFLKNHPGGNLIDKQQQLLEEVNRLEAKLSPAVDVKTGVLDAFGNPVTKPSKKALSPKEETRIVERLDELHSQLAPIQSEIENPTLPFDYVVNMRRRMDAAARSTFDQTKGEFTPEGALKRDLADTLRGKIYEKSDQIPELGENFRALNEEFHNLEAFKEDFDKAWSSEFKTMPKRKLKLGPVESQGTFVHTSSPYISPALGFSQPTRPDLINRGAGMINQSLVSPSQQFLQSVKNGTYKGAAGSMAAQQYNEWEEQPSQIPRTVEGVVQNRDRVFNLIIESTGDPTMAQQLAEKINYGSDEETANFLGSFLKAFPEINGIFQKSKSGAVSEFNGKVRDKTDLADMATAIENNPSTSLRDKAKAYNDLWGKGVYTGKPINSTPIPGQ